MFQTILSDDLFCAYFLGRTDESDIVGQIECRIARANSLVREQCIYPRASKYDAADNDDGDMGWGLFDDDLLTSVLPTNSSEVPIGCLLYTSPSPRDRG